MTDVTHKELTVDEKRKIEAAEGEHTREGVHYVPHVDIFEDSQAIALRADLPGVRKEDLDIDVREGVLTLAAVVDPLPEKWHPLCTEYQVGGFGRRFSLGERIDPEKINANLENGVLTLVLPKAESHKPRKVEIT